MNSYFKENKEIYQIYNLFHIEEILSLYKRNPEKIVQKKSSKKCHFLYGTF
jgi:hypothetical protein